MIHHVFAEQSNIGDLIAARGVREHLPTNNVTTLFCDSKNFGETVHLIRSLTDADSIVVGGGGLANRYFDPLWEALAEVRPGVRIIVWGIGLCDHKDRDSRGARDLLLAVRARSLHFSVRDSLTAKWLGLRAQEDPILCPSVVSLARFHTHASAESVTRRETLLAVVHPELLLSSEPWFRSLAEDAAHRDGLNIQFADNIRTMGSSGASTQLLREYAESSWVISSRLHGCVISVCFGRPVVAISADWKIESFMEAVGLGDWCIEPGNSEGFRDLQNRLYSQPSAATRIEAAVASNIAVGTRVWEVVRQ